MYTRSLQEMSMLPPEMNGNQKSGGLPDWQKNAQDTLAKSMDRPFDSVQRARPPKSTLRAVTPDSIESGVEDYHKAVDAIRLAAVELPSISQSQRSIPTGDKPGEKRNGLVFQDSHGNQPSETGRARPPVSFHSRTRTRTLDEPTRQRSTTTSLPKVRNRIGSVHSTTSPPFHDVEPRNDASSPFGHSSTRSSPQMQKSNSLKGGRRLLKKTSRPTSPLPAMSDVPSVDSLSYPVMTGDANKTLVLMKTLCGRMKGKVDYQNGVEVWKSGVCYIDDLRGSLMCEYENGGPYNQPVVSDLRGCRVRSLESRERRCKYLEISNPILGLDFRLVPLLSVELDLWLAAFLCWQQVRPQTISPKTSSTGERRPSVQSTKKRESTFREKDGSSKESNIIKVAKIQIWDNGIPNSPAAIVRGPLSRDLRSSSTRSWRRVSCLLSDNGEFKILTENDVTHISVIQLSQLSRSAIQRVDRSVLDEEFCIGLFPQYTSNSTHISILRPVYISLESRTLFEVWFCLLRSFSISEIYGIQHSNGSAKVEDSKFSADLFRVEKTLTVRVVEAKIRKSAVKMEELSPGKHPSKTESDLSVGDYFAEVVLDGEIRARTKTKTDTRNPFWREDCEFQDLPAYLPKLSIVLKRIQHSEVATHGLLSSSSIHVPSHPRETIYGTVEISVETLERGKDFENWYPILNNQQESLGEMFLKIRIDELVVLLAKEYQEISELLHRFNSGLTLEIAQATSTSLRKLSEILINIFQVSGHAGDWLKSLAEDEIDGIAKEEPVRRLRYSRRIGSNESSVSEREQSVRDMSKSLHGEANLLFRGNSLLTQALDIHMRRLGKEYLEEVLSEKVLKINVLNPDCEVDPARLSQGDDINKNWSQLISLTTEVWENMAGSAKRCPPSLRQILKYIRAVAEDRYGAFLRTATYTSVSGFLFLRFFCPALLNPKLFGLLRDHPPAKAQRTLTLIAKSLQALANLSNFGQKEVWMEPMNKFLASNRQSVKDYIDGVCSIPSERQTFVLPASYSTPITILARLPPTSREGFPSLPYLIDHARNFSALVKLWLDATAHRPASEVLEGDLLEFHRLCVGLQRRADQCLIRLDREGPIDKQSLQWDEIVEGLEKSGIRGYEDDDLDQGYDYEQGGDLVHDDDIMGFTPEFRSPQWAGTTPKSGTGQQAVPSSASSVVSKERKEKQGFWDFSKDGKDSKLQKPYDLTDPSQSSPPSRGPSRNGKQRFLPGFRRKGKDDAINYTEKES